MPLPAPAERGPAEGAGRAGMPPLALAAGRCPPALRASAAAWLCSCRGIGGVAGVPGAVFSLYSCGGRPQADRPAAGLAAWSGWCRQPPSLQVVGSEGPKGPRAAAWPHGPWSPACCAPGSPMAGSARQLRAPQRGAPAGLQLAVRVCLFMALSCAPREGGGGAGSVGALPLRPRPRPPSWRRCVCVCVRVCSQRVLSTALCGVWGMGPGGSRARRRGAGLLRKGSGARAGGGGGGGQSAGWVYRRALVPGGTDRTAGCVTCPDAALARGCACNSPPVGSMVARAPHREQPGRDEGGGGQGGAAQVPRPQLVGGPSCRLL
jgi:hypothetical protein